MFDHHGSEPIELMGAESPGFRKTHWLQPKLSYVIAVLNMNVRRLRPFQAIEKEAKTGRSQDSRHWRTPRD
jgi:hypothetical protein